MTSPAEGAIATVYCRAAGACASAAVVVAITVLVLVGLVPRAEAADRAIVPPRPAATLLESARLAPPDATLLIHVQGAGPLRDRIAGRAVEDAALELLGGDATRAAWRALAIAAGRDGTSLFDDLLGRSLTLVVRPGVAGPGPDWALHAAIGEADRARLVESLRPLRARPRAGLPAGRLPEQRLELVLAPGGLLVGPESGRLLDDVARRVVAPGGGDLPTLSDHEAVRRGGGLEPGHAAVLVRHAPPTGGWSVFVAGLEGGSLRIRHAGRYDDPPFTRGLPDRDWNVGPLEAFADGFALALAEPTSIDGGPALAWLEAILEVPLLGRDMGRHVADRRLVVIGRPADDAVMPPVAIAIEHEPTPGADAALDVHARRLAGAVADLLARPRAGLGGMHAPVGGPVDPLVGLGPAVRVRSLGAGTVDAGATIRVAELTPFLRTGTAMAALAGDRGLELAWTNAAGPVGHWYVVASDRDHARDVAARLAEADDLANTGRWSSCGLFDARGLARGLEAVGRGIGPLAGGDPQTAAVLEAAADRLANLLAVVDGGRWRLVRPDERSVELTIDLRLLPPRSGR